MAAVIKTFMTPGGNYVYDRETNSLLSVLKEEYFSCQRLEIGHATDDDHKKLNRFYEQGYLQESRLERIEHFATKYLPFYIKNQISQLTMQVTQDCNLRCSYCTYSGGYDHQRTHSKNTMSLETMKKCVDFVMERSRGEGKTALGFYGGEPLLEFDKIKACVDYIKNKYKNRTINYTITTNGTFFSDDIINFLHVNNFSVSISLDGPKDMHDLNRVYANGSGSFDDIVNNLEYIRIRFPDFYEKIMFRTVVSPKTSFSCVVNFFNVSNIMSEKSISKSIVSSFNLKNYVEYDDMYHIANEYQIIKVLFTALGMYNKEKISNLFKTELDRIKDLHKGLSIGTKMSITAHPGGPCLPGVMRLFVAYDGTMYPCERVNEESEIMKIGHIDTHINIDKAVSLLNVGKLTSSECKACWNFYHCSLCCAASDAGTHLSKELRLENCKTTKNNTLNEFAVMCFLMENGFNFNE